MPSLDCGLDGSYSAVSTVLCSGFTLKPHDMPAFRAFMPWRAYWLSELNVMWLLHSIMPSISSSVYTGAYVWALTPISSYTSRASERELAVAPSQYWRINGNTAHVALAFRAAMMQTPASRLTRSITSRFDLSAVAWSIYEGFGTPFRSHSLHRRSLSVIALCLCRISLSKAVPSRLTQPRMGLGRTALHYIHLASSTGHGRTSRLPMRQGHLL